MTCVRMLQLDPGQSISRGRHSILTSINPGKSTTLAICLADDFFSVHNNGHGHPLQHNTNSRTPRI